MRMKTCLTLILTEMEAESEEDDDDEDDYGKKVSGDAVQSRGSVTLAAVAICRCLFVKCCLFSLFCYLFFTPSSLLILLFTLNVIGGGCC